MKWDDLQTLSYVGDIVSVNGEDLEVSTKLATSINAVQFHSGNNYVLEELGTGKHEKASLSKYNFLLEEIEIAIAKMNAPTPYDVWNQTTLSFKKDLELCKEYQKEKLNKACKKAITSGFESSALGTTHIYESEEEDQLNLTGLKDRGTTKPLKCSSDNTQTWEWKEHTPEQIKQVFDDGVDFKLNQLIKVSQLKNKVETATTVAKVLENNWS